MVLALAANQAVDAHKEQHAANQMRVQSDLAAMAGLRERVAVDMMKLWATGSCGEQFQALVVRTSVKEVSMCAGIKFTIGKGLDYLTAGAGMLAFSALVAAAHNEDHDVISRLGKAALGVAACVSLPQLARLNAWYKMNYGVASNVDARVVAHAKLDAATRRADEQVGEARLESKRADTSAV